MYNAHFGLARSPFSPTPSPDFIFESRELREALAHFRYALENREAFLLLTGEVGTGKTTAVQTLIRLLPPGTPVAVVSHSTLDPRELVEEVALRFGLEGVDGRSKPQILHALEEFFENQWREARQAILILDEAHLLDRAVLEEVRLLSNLEREGGKLVQICLVGQPELAGHLHQSDLRQLRQRISIRYALRPLSREETCEYIHHRLRVAGSADPGGTFPGDACDAVHRATNGIPREINVIAGQAMLNAFLEDARAVTPQHVRTVQRDYGFEGIHPGGAEAGPAPPPPPPPTLLAGPRDAEAAFPPPRREMEPPPWSAPAAGAPAASPPHAAGSEAGGGIPGPSPRPIPLPPPHLRPAPPAEGHPAPAAPPETRAPIEIVAPPAPAVTPTSTSRPAVVARPRAAARLAAGVGHVETSPTSPRPWLRRALGLTVVLAVVATAIYLVTSGGGGGKSGDTLDPSSESPAPRMAGGSPSGAPEEPIRPGLSAVAAGDSASAGSVPEDPSAGGAAAETTLVPEPPAGAAAGEAGSARGPAGATSPAGTPRVTLSPDLSGESDRPITVQIGSFETEARAVTVLAEAEQLTGLKGMILPARVRGNPGYRILLGSFTSAEAAGRGVEILLRRRMIAEVAVRSIPEGLENQLAGPASTP